MTTHPPALRADLPLLRSVLDSAPIKHVDLQPHQHEHFDVFVDWLDGTEDWFPVHTAEELLLFVDHCMTPGKGFHLEAVRVTDSDPSLE